MLIAPTECRANLDRHPVFRERGGLGGGKRNAPPNSLTLATPSRHPGKCPRASLGSDCAAVLWFSLGPGVRPIRMPTKAQETHAFHCTTSRLRLPSDVTRGRCRSCTFLVWKSMAWVRPKIAGGRLPSKLPPSHHHTRLTESTYESDAVSRRPPGVGPYWRSDDFVQSNFSLQEPSGGPTGLA